MIENDFQVFRFFEVGHGSSEKEGSYHNF